MKILFLHLNRDASTEYGIHRNLAAHVDPGAVTAYFFWQRSARWNEASPGVRDGYDHFFDMGRDLSLRPRPSRPRRAWLMARGVVRNGVRIHRLVRSIRPDLVYVCQQDMDLAVAAWLRVVHRVPWLVHVNYPMSPMMSPVVRRLVRRSTEVIACSSFVRDTVVADGTTPGVIRVLHNPADTEAYLRPRGRRPDSSETGIPPGAAVILCAARIDVGKGQDALVEAFARISGAFPDAVVAICGEPFGPEDFLVALRRRVVELGLEHRVLFLGQREDLPALMAESQVFCLPTEHEAFGLVFVEAMAAGLPVVAVRSGGVPEVVVDGVTGLLSEPGDLAALAANLARLLAEPHLRRQMGEAGRARALDRFAPSRVAEAWLDILSPGRPAAA